MTPTTRDHPTANPPAPTLDAVIGQDAAVDTLRAAVNAGRVHHAWVFAGPAGVGKRTAAVAFAALLLDPTTDAGLDGVPRPEPDSPTQRLVAAGTHPDLHIITKELAAYADDARVRRSKQRTIAKDVLVERLIKPVGLAPSLSTASIAAKVFIIDEAELMDASPNNAPTQNAILKTLEEPPEGSVIILVAAQEHRLLPTIRSRCQRVAFTPLNHDDMQRWLDLAKLSPTPTQRAWIDRYAHGSPGKAALAIQTGLADWPAALAPGFAAIRQRRFHPDLPALLAKLIDDWAAESVKAGERAGQNPSKEAANHAATTHLLDMLAEDTRLLLRDAIDRGDQRDAQARLRAIDRLTRAEAEIRANVRPRFAFEKLFAQALAEPA